MKTSFLDFFPPPQFLEMRSIGLAISERAVHAVELVRKDHGLALGKFGTRPIPEGAIHEGYINNKDAVTAVLKSLQKELNIEFVSACLPEEKAYLFRTEIPRVRLEDVRQTIEFQIEENVPISAQDAIFDYEIIPGAGDAEHLAISVSVFPSKVVYTYLEIIKAAGMKPVLFGVEAQAVSRAVLPTGSPATYIIVNVGDSRTNLSIVGRGVVQFSITVPFGGDSFVSALAKHFNVNREEAIKIKEEKGFVKNRENMELFVSLTSVVSSIKDEINKLLIYWKTHQNQNDESGAKIEKIVLCGRDAHIVGFDEYLSVALKIPVEVADVWRNMPGDSVPAIKFVDSLDYASAIGLVLP